MTTLMMMSWGKSRAWRRGSGNWGLCAYCIQLTKEHRVESPSSGETQGRRKKRRGRPASPARSLEGRPRERAPRPRQRPLANGPAATRWAKPQLTTPTTRLFSSSYATLFFPLLFSVRKQENKSRDVAAGHRARRVGLATVPVRRRSGSPPRRRRDAKSRLTAAASPRPVSPPGTRGDVAARLRGISTWHPRRCRGL